MPYLEIQQLQKNGAQNMLPDGLALPWVRASRLPELFCSWDLAYRCIQSGWLTPVVKGNRRTIYRMVDVMTCMKRIESGEMPAKRIKRTLPTK